MNPPTDIETRLRASLTENARHAPPGDGLADRILAELDAPVLRPRGGWRTWTFPLLAAAAIAAVAFTLAGVGADRHTAAPPLHPGSRAVTHPVPTVHVPTTAQPSPTATTSTPVPITGFHAFDVTFVGTTYGWALGSEPCIDNPAHRCTAILRTTDGRTWSGIGGESFNVADVQGCADPCVQHVRFANQTIGYAYGPNALFMTTDGGASWVQQKGMGADALETLSGNVILVRVINTGCPGSCPLLERAPIGSSAWTSFTLPQASELAAANRIDLARDGQTAILAPIFYNPAKPTVVSSALYRSSDDGATWTRVKAACPYVGIGYQQQLTAATMSSDGSVAIDCATTTRTNPTGYGETALSTDGGRTFTSPVSGGKLRPGELIAGASGDVQLLVVEGTLYRSNDGGNSWSRVPNLTDVTFIGFENQSDGRAVAAGGRTIWVTHDRGASWTGGPFAR